MKLPLGIVCFAGPSLLSASVFNFSDTGFNPSEWSADLIYNTTASVASYTTIQAGSGGNPGVWRETTHAYDTGGMAVGQINKTFVFAPLLHGGVITSVGFSYDFNVIDAGASLAVAHGLAITQLGRYYVAAYVSQTPSGGWVGHSASGLTASSFTEYNGTAHPDFSAPLAFGYVTGNGTAGGLTSTDHGLDNFSVTFTTVPEPPALAWVGLFGGGALTWSLVRRRCR
jgi:hypothetical protein